MVVRRIIPDAYTEYEDGRLGVVPASLANVEAKIGAADGGIPGKVYTLSGPDAKEQARTIFQSGPLLRALHEAFDAGSTRIHAVRIGSSDRASITFKDVVGRDTLRIKGTYAESGNNHWANLTHHIDSIPTRYVGVAYDGSPFRFRFYDEYLNVTSSFPLPPEITSVVGADAEYLPDLPSYLPKVWVAGFGSSDQPMLWRFTGQGALIPEDTIDLSPYIPEGDSLTGLATTFGGPLMMLMVTTNRHILMLRYLGAGSVEMDGGGSYEDMGLVNPDISSMAIAVDIKRAVNEQVYDEAAMILLERTGKRIYRIPLGDEESPSGSVDISPWVTWGSPEGLAIDLDNGQLLVAVYYPANPGHQIFRFAVDWLATPEPTVTLVASQSINGTVMGLGQYVSDAEGTTRITIQDRNQSPIVSRVYEGSGGITTLTPAVAQAVNDGGIYEAELLTDPAFWLMPSMPEDSPPDPTYFEQFEGGSDTDEPTNADYLAGLAATIPKTDTAWIHAVGAQTNALWTAILLHCAEMFEDHAAERFAILETPQFSSPHEEGSAGYLADLQDYTDEITAMLASVGDRNAVVFAGGAQFMDADGNLYTGPITAACGGTMAALEVQKSLINKRVRNVIALMPEFSPGHIQSLIQARCNCIRFKPGRGFIIAHSLTAGSVGSDYSRVNDLRAVYYGAKAAREAAQIYVGEENDVAGEGLRRLESAMSRPLEVMRDGGQIDSFDLRAVSTPNDRLLGDVYISLGIQPRRAMEMIYTTVYLK